MSEEKTKEQRNYEDQLRYRIKILQKKFKEGKIGIVKGLEDVEESLLAVRTGPDGEVDLDTVDGRVRSLALAVTVMHEREELKESASLSEIQNIYFNIIEQNFGHFYKIMDERNLTPHDAGRALTQNPETVEKLTENLEEFLAVIDEYWSEVGEIAQIHIEDMHGNIKGIFGGDLFPSHDENIASKCGIYTDTIILPDPFLRSKHIFAHYGKEDKAYYLIKHAMNLLQYKTLACAAVDVPIVVILPDYSALESDEKEFCHKLGQEDALIHSGRLFGRTFESVDELLEYAGTLDTIERTVAEIEAPDRVLFNTEWGKDPATQIQKALNSKHFKELGVDTPGAILAMQSVMRMSISNEILIRASRLNGTPIIDAPTSWQYLTWKMEYDVARIEQKTNLKDLYILKGLQDLAGSDMQWIGNIPIEALVEVRQQGAMDEIRNILGNGVSELISSNPTNFHRSRDQIFDNIREAFQQHQRKINTLRDKKWEFAGHDIFSWLVTGSLGITAAVTGVPVWGLAAIAANQLLDAPKLRDIPQSIRYLADENNKIQKSPVGMLFNVSKKNS